MTNSLADLYGLIRFGCFQPWNDWKEFSDHVVKIQQKRPDLAGRRAQAILKRILIRRTKSSTVEGRPILLLGEKNINVAKLDFSPRERKIYDALEKRQREKLNRIIDRGRLAKESVLCCRSKHEYSLSMCSYHFILVMILRLRQGASPS